ncbi:hypothetical protein AVEN_134022-1 [Araneus ventricosus]|uniref:Uncharacterized protein n=1 Tax=Araneus ventricosus TaxID=182803 RepID=A0A4Y2K336_ARAVE|nr:hypothetical protein AVEN_134022-1 [Araneus ventricosus]
MSEINQKLKSFSTCLIFPIRLSKFESSFTTCLIRPIRFPPLQLKILPHRRHWPHRLSSITTDENIRKGRRKLLRFTPVVSALLLSEYQPNSEVPQEQFSM